MWPAAREQSRRGVAEEHVREREVVLDRKVEVRLEEVQRTVKQGVADPCHLPGEVERIAPGAADRGLAAEGNTKWPGHHDSHADGEQRRELLAPRHVCARFAVRPATRRRTLWALIRR